MHLFNRTEFKQKSTCEEVEEKNQTDQVSALPTLAHRQKVSQKNHLYCSSVLDP